MQGPTGSLAQENVYFKANTDVATALRKDHKVNAAQIYLHSCTDCTEMVDKDTSQVVTAMEINDKNQSKKKIYIFKL